MSIDWNTLYPTQTDPADAEYPDGKARNITVPGDGLGTPLEKTWMNDRIGFASAILSQAGEVPNGNPDTVLVPQVLNALKKGRAHIDARAFGAVGDGVADDTTELQAAIDFVTALTGGGSVVFQAGTFISQKLVLKTNVDLIGVGGTIKLKDNSDSALLEIPVGASEIRVEGLILDGNAANNIGTPDNIGLLHVLSTNVAPTRDVTVESCRILDAYQDAVHLTDGVARFWLLNNFIDGTTAGDAIKLCQLVPTLETVTAVRVIGNHVRGFDESGLLADGIVFDLVVAHNVFDGSSGGGTDSVVRIRHGSSQRVLVDSNIVKNGTSNGMLVGAEDLIVSNNVLDANQGTSLLINTAGGTPIETAVVSNNTLIADGSSTDAMGILDVTNISIIGNSCSDFPDGIEVAATRYAITGNTVKGHTSRGIVTLTSGAPVTQVGGTIVGNTVIGVAPGSTTTGINIQGSEGECACTGNRVTDCATGILESGATDFNAIVGNVAKGNTVPITVIGAGTISANNVV